MQAELRDSLEFLFSDSEVSRRPRQKIEVDVARGGTIAVNVLTAGLPEQGKLKLSVRQNRAPVHSAQWSRLHHVSVEKNTGPDGFELKCGQSNPHVIRKAPFRVYDAMEPIGTSVKSGGNVALRLDVPVGRDERPGRRELSIELVCGSQRIELLVPVRVHKATIPPAGKGSLPYTNWFTFENMASRHGLKMWSQSHWRMIRKYARLMAHARQNMFLVPISTVFRRAARGFVLDRDRLERLVKLFTDEGLWFIEGGHFGRRHKGEWNAEYFDLVPDGPRATGPGGNAEIANISRQLMQVIRENKWQDRWIQHVTDEPTTENAVDYRIFVGMAHKYMPGVPILDATMDVTLAGSVDIWCPQAQEYQRHRREFSLLQKLGDKVYFYTCCCPGGPWLNRLLDMELLRPALFGWAAARFGLDGFLHWGFNYWQDGQDPFQMNNIPWPPGNGPKPNCLPAGDTHISYPGSDGPWSSVRLEAQREGFEDYELLKALGEKNRSALKRVSGRAIRAFDRYVRDVSVFRRARRALLEATQ